jgi:hypothetical protein
MRSGESAWTSVRVLVATGLLLGCGAGGSQSTAGLDGGDAAADKAPVPVIDGATEVIGTAPEAPADGGADDSDAPSEFHVIAPTGLVVENGHLFVAQGAGNGASNSLLEIDVARDTASVVADLSAPSISVIALASDRAGRLFLTTGHGAVVVKVDVASGTRTVLAGSYYAQDHLDGVGPEARFRSTIGLALDGRGNMYVTDQFDYTIRKIVIASGSVSSFAGVSQQSGRVDGVGSAARFVGPKDITYDRASDALYLSDYTTVRKIDPVTAEVTTLAGTGTAGTLTDGVGRNAAFDYVGSIVADGQGSLFVGDRATIRRILLATAEVTTVAGHVGGSISRDGTGATAFLTDASAIGPDGMGALYFLSCQTIRRLELATGTITTLYGLPEEAYRLVLGCVTNGRPLHAE